MDSCDDIEAWFLKEAGDLLQEADIVYEQLVLPYWGSSDLHGFPHALYGYLMNAMALLDRLSCYDAGNQRDETGRMTRTLVTWFNVDEDVAKLTVQLWRHKLMHTGVPLRMRNPTTGVIYTWLLHWKEHLPRDVHMRLHEAPSIANTPHKTILQIALIYLIEDLQAAAGRFFDAYRSDQTKRSAIETVHTQIQDALFSL